MALKMTTVSTLPKTTRKGGGRTMTEESKTLLKAMSDGKVHKISVKNDAEAKKFATKVRSLAQRNDVRVSVRIADDGVFFQKAKATRKSSAKKKTTRKK